MICASCRMAVLANDGSTFCAVQQEYTEAKGCNRTKKCIRAHTRVRHEDYRAGNTITRFNYSSRRMRKRSYYRNARKSILISLELLKSSWLPLTDVASYARFSESDIKKHLALLERALKTFGVRQQSQAR